MKKTLGRIQGLMKFGRVISIIVLVCAVLGMIGCAIGGVALYATSDVAIEALDGSGSTTVGELVTDETMVSMEFVYYALIVAFLVCMTEVIISDRIAKYFKFEINEGTPFTFEGAKKLKKVGILAIILPIIVEIISLVGAMILLANTPELITDSSSTEITYASSIGMGIVILLFALIFKHGAELNEAQKTVTQQKDALSQKLEQRRNYY